MNMTRRQAFKGLLVAIPALKLVAINNAEPIVEESTLELLIKRKMEELASDIEANFERQLWSISPRMKDMKDWNNIENFMSTV